MNRFEREVRRLLADLGATNIYRESRSNPHPLLWFSYQNKEYPIEISASPKNQTGALLSVKRSLKQMLPQQEEEITMETPLNPVLSQELGSALHTEVKGKEVMKELLAKGKVGYYPSSGCLMFAFPSEILTAIGVKDKSPFIATVNGDGWELTPGGDKARANTVGNRVQICIYVQPDKILSHKRGFFRATAAEYLAIDGKILVSLIEPPLPYVAVTEKAAAKVAKANRSQLTSEEMAAKARRTAQDVQRMVTAPVPTPAPKTAPVAFKRSPTNNPVVAWLKEDMSEGNIRMVLYAMRYIEEQNTYVVGRVEGKLVLNPKNPVRRID